MPQRGFTKPAVQHTVRHFLGAKGDNADFEDISCGCANVSFGDTDRTKNDRFWHLQYAFKSPRMQRWSGSFDQFSVGLSYSVGFISGGKSHVAYAAQLIRFAFATQAVESARLANCR